VKAAKAIGTFAVISAALILIATVILRIYFRSAVQHRAMLISAGLAFAVQLSAYALVRPARGGHGAPGELLLRWGASAVLRFAVLVLYAPLARVMFLSLDAALVSLATFFFVTMMAEPLILEYDR
jgi:hypothetical protein